MLMIWSIMSYGTLDIDFRNPLHVVDHRYHIDSEYTDFSIVVMISINVHFHLTIFYFRPIH